jgi:glycosyltransferase involved in cell wall biosynthesis
VGPQKAFYSPTATQAINQASEEASTLHAHGLYVGTNYALGRAARRLNKPLVYHAHGFYDPYILRRSRWLKRLAHLLFEDRNFRQVQLWRALTQKEAQQLKQAGIQAPIAVVPNGVELPQPECRPPLPEALQKKRPYRLLFLGRLHPKKGLPLLLGAWSQLSDHLEDWELAVVGPDEGGHLRELETLIAADPERLNSVRLLGPVSGDTKTAIYQSASAFALTSYSEGFPMALLEAASHCLPVLQTTECNFPELEQAGGSWTADPTPASVLVALQSLIKASVAERTERGEAGFELVKRRYQWSQVALALEAACQQTANSPH